MAEATDLSKAWQLYVNVFDEARERMENLPRFAHNEDYRRRMYRNLMQVQAMAYNFAIVPRPDRPRCFVHTTYQTDFYRLGMACPDFHYTGLFLDGSRRYRITGKLGAVCWMGAQVQSQLMGDADAQNVGEFDFAAFANGPDKSFDVIASGQNEVGHHIQLAPDSAYNFVWVRKIFGDWSDDAGEVHIELIPDGRQPEPESETDLIGRLNRATAFARFLLNNWSIGLYDWYLDLTKGENKIALLGGARVADKEVGSLNAYYANFVFNLKPDEALVIEGDVPSGAYWGLQIGDVWSESLDYVYRQTDINMVRLAIDTDGKFRAIISVQDHGIANWLDPEGNEEGIGIMRVFGSKAPPPLPILRVVKAEDLSHLLPSGTKRITAEERAKAIAHRTAGIRRMYQQ